jgi:hypothetical protein
MTGSTCRIQRFKLILYVYLSGIAWDVKGCTCQQYKTSSSIRTLTSNIGLKASLTLYTYLQYNERYESRSCIILCSNVGPRSDGYINATEICRKVGIKVDHLLGNTKMRLFIKELGATYKYQRPIARILGVDDMVGRGCIQYTPPCRRHV